MEEDPSQSSRRSTRAQLAPSWTSPETLTLLKQISAVDRDCRNTIASFQKWKMVSGNLAAAGVHRSLDQCRRKWASLLAAYTKAKELGSYWNLDDDVRARDGVSEDFDLEVFKVMDEYLKRENEEGERENGGEETDPDVGAAGIDDDMADSLTEDHEDESGFEKQKNHLLACKKRSAVETVSKPMKLKEAAKKRKRPQIVPSVLSEEVDEEVNLLNEQKMLLATNHQSSEEEVGEEEDDEGQVLAEKLLESAKSVKAIVRLKLSDSDDFLTADSRDVETDFIRHQGDQLIEYLRKLARTLKQLCEVDQ